MRILQVVGEINGGGVGAVVLNYLAHMNLEDLECDILAFKIRDIEYQLLDSEFRKLGCNVIYMEHRNKGYVKHFKEFKRILALHKYDVVHCHFGIWSTLYLAIAYEYGIKTRIAHSHIAKDEYSFWKQSLLNATKPLLNLVVTDRMACGNEAGKYLWGNKKYIVINNAVDVDKFKYDPIVRKKIRSRLNMEEDCIVLGHIGRFSYQKNHSFLIELLEKMQFNNKVKLILIGNGEDFTYIKTIVKDKHLENSILLLGLRSNVSELLQAMDIFLLPSRYEGLPVVTIEAQCSGLPCVISNQVTSEAVLLEKSSELPIEPKEECLHIWINTIQNIITNMRSCDRTCDYIKVCEAGYDINIEAKKLREFYISRGNGSEKKFI